MVATLVTRRQARLLLALLLAVGLLFAAVGPAVAAADDEFGADPEAVQRLVEVGLVKGRATGDGEVDFALEATITRAELVTVLVRAFGGEPDAEAYDGEAPFPDVTADHWAYGFIAVAAGLSHQPLGYPDGTFGPDREVTAAEVVAFTMKFLGIDEAEGEWPDNYVDGLAAAGIVDEASVAGLKFIANAAAPRGVVFTLLDMAFATYEVEEGKTIYDVLAEVSDEAAADGEAADDEDDDGSDGEKNDGGDEGGNSDD